MRNAFLFYRAHQHPQRPGGVQHIFHHTSRQGFTPKNQLVTISISAAVCGYTINTFTLCSTTFTEEKNIILSHVF